MHCHWGQLVSWPVVKVVLGVSLLVAGSLKGYEVATEVLPEDNLLTSRWMMTLVVEWEVFLAVWLLCGFDACCPRATYIVALVYFCALFGVAVEAVIAERPSCGCLGKVNVHPWGAVTFDFAVVTLLAIAMPVGPGVGESLKPHRWAGLIVGLSVFGMASFVTMKDYSTVGAIPQFRRDRMLNRLVTIELIKPSTEEILRIGRDATGVELAVDDSLRDRQPDYGTWQLRKTRLWAVMETLACRQTVPVRWTRVGDGYMMVPAARFGKSLTFWIGSAVLLVSFVLSLRMLDDARSRTIVYS
jgi:hypothetical protein